MSRILTSASKIAFIGLTGSAALAYLVLAAAVLTGKLPDSPTVSQVVDIFKTLAVGASAYYFGYKNSNGSGDDPIAGK